MPEERVIETAFAQVSFHSGRSRLNSDAPVIS